MSDDSRPPHEEVDKQSAEIASPQTISGSRESSNGKVVQQTVQVSRMSYEGPIPPPGLLAEYAKIIPSGPERILTMAENEQSERHFRERTKVLGQVRAQATGQYLSFVVALCGIIGGIYLAATGKEAIGGSLSGGTLLSFALLYFEARWRQKRERTTLNAEQFQRNAEG